MKKIISLVAALSLAATTFVSFATVASAAATYEVKATVMTNDEYKAVTSNDIPDGAAAYAITLDVSNIEGSAFASVAKGLFNDTSMGAKSAIFSAQLELMNMTMIHSVTTTNLFGTSTTYTTGVLSDNVIGKSGYDTTTGSLNHIAAPSTDYTTLYPTAEIAYTSAQTAVDNLFSYYVVVNDKKAFSISYEGVVNYKSFLNGAINGDTVSEYFRGTLSFAGVEEEDPEVPATAIAINGDDVVEADVGATGTLTATVTPDTTTDTIAWASNDECVTIDEATGAWSAVKPGKATITVTAGSVSDTVVIKVKPVCTVGDKWVHEDGIVWGKNTITGAAFGKNFKATFTDGVTTKNQAITGLETAGAMTFDAVLKVYSAVAEGAEIVFSMSWEAAE